MNALILTIIFLLVGCDFSPSQKAKEAVRVEQEKASDAFHKKNEAGLIRRVPTNGEMDQ